MRPLLLLGVFALGLLGLLAAVASAASADTCSLSVALAPAVSEVSVHGGDSPIAIIDGAFSVSASPDMPDAVWFTLTVPTGWDGTLTPTAVAFGPAVESNGTLNVTVYVPPGEPASNAGVVRLIGRATSGEALCAEAFAEVRVQPRPFFDPVEIRASPEPADLNPATGFATVDLMLRSFTNAPGPVLARLTVRPPEGVTHDAPQDVALAATGPDTVGGSVTVNFRPPSTAPRTYTVSVFAAVLEANNTGGVRLVRMTTIQVRVLPQPMNGAIVALTGIGAMVTLATAVWTWQVTRPARR